MYQVLTLEQQDEWQGVIDLYKHRLDVSYQPGYNRVLQEEGMGKAHLFWYNNGQNQVLYPFFLRRINDIPYFRERLSEEYYDITSPYGYGGPVISSPEDHVVPTGFKTKFLQFCSRYNVVTEFIRFHPLLKNHEYKWEDFFAVEKARSIVILDMNKSSEEIWSGYRYSNRKNVARARREGLEVLIEESPAHFRGFFEIYQKTMDRRQAGSFYYFSEKFFSNIHQFLLGKFVYAHVFRGEQMISTELLLFHDGIIHSFLGGTLPEFFYCRPNNLLKHEVSLWARKKECRYFVLGGGYEENDGIFQYKLSFAPGGIKDFYIGKRVHHPGAMKILETIKGVGKEETGGFFPAYRKE